MSLGNISRPIAEPVDNYPDAAARATQKVICFAAPFLAGLALRTPQTSVFALAFLLYGALACGDEGGNNNQIPRRPAVGGQCPGVSYRFAHSVRYYTSGGGTTTTLSQGERTLTGPIRFTRVAPEGLIPFNSSAGTYIGTAFQLSTPFGVVPGQQQYTITRPDGLPDNCGDGPGAIPLPPPDPGPGPYPPIINPPNGGPVYVEVDVGGNKTLSVPIIIAPIIINVDKLFPIEITIDGVEFELGADFELNEKEGGAGGLTPEQADQLDEAFDTADRDKLNAVFNELSLDRTLQLTGGLCEDEVVSLAVSGNGIGLLAAAMQQESNLRYTQAKGLCPPPPPEQQSEQLIYAVTAVSGNLEFVSPSVSNEVVRIKVVITGFNPNLVPETSYYARASQRKFGTVALSFDGEAAGGEFLYLWDQVTYWTLPRRARDANIRLLVSQSVSVSVYDTGDRLSLYGV